VQRGVDCNERCLYAALIIHCVDCGVAESRSILIYGADSSYSTSSLITHVLTIPGYFLCASEVADGVVELSGKQERLVGETDS
jgi:hypothetical protein